MQPGTRRPGSEQTLAQGTSEVLGSFRNQQILDHRVNILIIRLPAAQKIISPRGGKFAF